MRLKETKNNGQDDCSPMAYSLPVTFAEASAASRGQLRTPYSSRRKKGRTAEGFHGAHLAMPHTPLHPKLPKRAAGQ